MFYRKNLSAPMPRQSRIQLSDFSGGLNLHKDEDVLPLNFARMTYNFDCSKGALKDGLGASQIMAAHIGKQGDEIYKPFDRALKLHFYSRYNFDTESRDDRLIVYADDKYLYELRLYAAQNAFTQIPSSYFESAPVFANYRLNGEDVLIVSSPSDNMLVYDGVNEPYRVEDAPYISSMAIHYERLFATSDTGGSALWFSDDLDPTVWDVNLESAGFIQMADERGALIKVISFLDYLYVFREYGITRVSAYYDQTQFFVSQLWTAAGRISSETVKLCGDRIIFMASDGVYSFDGLNAVPIMPQIKGALIDRGNACAEYHNGKYYLACYMDYGDGNQIMCEKNAQCKNNTIICYDIQNKSFGVTRGIDVKSFATVRTAGGEVLTAALNWGGNGTVYTIDNSGCFDGAPMPKFWASPASALRGSDTQKTITAVYLKSNLDCEIILIVDGIEHRYKVCGSDKISRIRANVTGRMFSFCFAAESAAGTYISNPALVIKSI